MHKTEYNFSQNKVTCYFDANFSMIKELVKDAAIVIITDENVFTNHADKMAAYPVIKIPAGEEHKNQATVEFIIAELIKIEEIGRAHV